MELVLHLFLPDYILPAGAKEGDPRVAPAAYNADINSPSFNLITKANKAGTDWQREIFKTAPMTQHNLSILGGSDRSRYGVSFNYFDQDGIGLHTFSKRYSFRANTEFKVKKYITVGQNLTAALESSLRGNVDILGGIRAQSIMPLYDINGFYAGAKGLGTNAGNPFAATDRAKDNLNRYNTIFGNIYGELNLGFLDNAFGSNILKDLTFRSSIGGNVGGGRNYGFTYRNIESAEPNSSNAFSENFYNSTNYTFSNTLTWDKTFGSNAVKILIGAEAIEDQDRGIGGTRSNYFTDAKNFWTLSGGSASGQSNYSYENNSSLFSLFARADATISDKYILSGTVRRDGSSRFGPDNRYAIFPAFSVGWRLSKEPFMEDVTWLDDFKVRFGWGQTGNQDINSTNAYSQYSQSIGTTAYDINGNSNNPQAGFSQSSLGNLKTKWETTTSTNLGFDLAILNGKFDMTLDLWNRKTTDLLYQLPLPTTAGAIRAPAVNIGDMNNKGFDLGLNYRGNATQALKFDVGLVLGAYKNEILRVGSSDETYFFGGGSRFSVGGITRGIKGLPISSYFGYKVVGIFKDKAEVDAAPDHGAVGGAKIGRWRFADLNNDKIIDDKDYASLGSPHPDFTYGLNLGLTYKKFDFTAFFQGVQGNEIYNYVRYWIDFEVFNGNRSYESLYESWDPQTNPNSLLPRLDFNDQQSNQSSNSYYVEDGSYLRLKNLQLGFSLPGSSGHKLGLENLRLFVQGLNLFTITKYRGYDPAFNVNDPNASLNGTSNADWTIGIDYGQYPVARTILFGLTASF
jgi:TonB-linked SusC/RagA family outer membrane protein